ncbi:SMI1/KNR4 family protein [Myxococcus sp. NMCA1]|uniref:SMI1/KNR4 family protein n=1 Tax=Myxococcus sp. NMCA1 TaxID=2996785 RepID=UPI002286A8C8|nr:SMI1/KNR4 family protein [Myxococcus sp. NMCA1]WAM25994.1 SMI1/KNR4 family protein [Myxococcus sp. NMCA1]
MKSLVEFIENYRPDFSKEIVPADEIDIALLERKAGSLPGAYRHFLETMGASMGGLELAEASLSIEGTLDVYNAKTWLQHGRYIPVAGDNGPSGFDWFLDRSTPYGSDDCLVVRMPLSKNYPADASSPQYVGLEEFLYCEAFKELRLPQLPFRRKFSSPDDAAVTARYRSDVVTALAEEKGFKRIPPAEHCALYERGDAALLLYRHPTQPTFSFILGCEDSAELEQLAQEFETRTGLKSVVTR